MVCPTTLGQATLADLGLLDLNEHVTHKDVRYACLLVMIEAVHKVINDGIAPLGYTDDEYESVIDEALTSSGAMAFRLLGWSLG